MTALPPDDPEDSRHRTGARERALVLLLCGGLLLLPPGAQIYEIEAKIGGVPVALAALFVIWAGLIVGARASARALTRADPDADFGP